MQAPTLMLIYAAGMLAGGGTAFMLAPPQANPVTALLVPGIAAGLMSLCAMASAIITRNKLVGMIGVHLGLIFPLLFAGGMVPRALAAGEASAQYTELAQAYQTETGASADADIQAFESWQRARDSEAEPVLYDKAYLKTTLWALSAWSVLAFIAILLKRPKPAQRDAGTAPEPAVDQATD
ncbi:MAG: hypothetical protein AAGB51_02450 [Planctomycetota bacterium]